MTTVAAAPRVQITATDIASVLGLPKGTGVVGLKTAATYLGEPEDQVGTWCRTHKLQAYKGGAGGRTSSWRITLQALAAFVNAQAGQR